MVEDEVGFEFLDGSFWHASRVCGLLLAISAEINSADEISDRIEMYEDRSNRILKKLNPLLDRLNDKAFLEKAREDVVKDAQDLSVKLTKSYNASQDAIYLLHEVYLKTLKHSFNLKF